MSDKIELNKELIRNNPNLSGNEIYLKSKKEGIGIRKKVFYETLREVRELSEPSIQKRIKSIPSKFKTKEVIVKLEKKVKVKRKPKAKVKPITIPYEQTKFGKMAKDIEKKHNISEKKAIRHTRKILKIPKRDYRHLNTKDLEILSQYGY